MSQEEIGNKIPIYKLKAGKQVEKYYDDWTLKNKYDKDMLDWKYSGPQETVDLFIFWTCGTYRLINIIHFKSCSFIDVISTCV